MLSVDAQQLYPADSGSVGAAVKQFERIGLNFLDKSAAM